MIINILSIILLVFGVLQIILFFKLWGNDKRCALDKRPIRSEQQRTRILHQINE